MWPQITLLVIYLIRLIVNIVRDGEPTNRYFDAMNCIIGLALSLFVLYCGGFFDCFFHAH
jgi:hypothetical protein